MRRVLREKWYQYCWIHVDNFVGQYYKTKKKKLELLTLPLIVSMLLTINSKDVNTSALYLCSSWCGYRGRYYLGTSNWDTTDKDHFRDKIWQLTSNLLQLRTAPKHNKNRTEEWNPEESQQMLRARQVQNDDKCNQTWSKNYQASATIDTVGHV
jgi:hypothetical protein